MLGFWELRWLKGDLLCVPSFQEDQLFQAIPEHPGEKRKGGERQGH